MLIAKQVANSLKETVQIIKTKAKIIKSRAIALLTAFPIVLVFVKHITPVKQFIAHAKQNAPNNCKKISELFISEVK